MKSLLTIINCVDHNVVLSSTLELG